MDTAVCWHCGVRGPGPFIEVFDYIETLGDEADCMRFCSPKCLAKYATGRDAE